MHFGELVSHLDVDDNDRGAFERQLDALCYDGTLDALPGNRFKTARERHKPTARGEEREGVLTVNARGFGFVAAATHANDDVFIEGSQLGGAMHLDRVRVRVTRRGQRGVEGEIIEVLERGLSRVAGILRRRGKSTWVEPDDPRVRGPIALSSQIDNADGQGNSGTDGDAVVVHITRFPMFADEMPQAVLEAVLGKPGELNVEAAKILLLAGIKELHSENAVHESEAYGVVVPEDMKQGRVDFRHLPLPTIDPEDARDHDDAVWVERTDDGGYRAFIAIADVSSYVTPGTAIDAEALVRGCSVYLPDRAVPMLPRALSSNLCSLLPDEDRLCLCAEIALDAGGNILGKKLHRGLMRSQAKLTYGGVARALRLTELQPVDPKAEALLDGLRVARDLSLLLRNKRMKRGALDFELPEAKVTLDPVSGEPVSVRKRSEDPGMKKAYQLIEELMLLANEVVAEMLTARQVPTVYRVHAPPDAMKLDRLAGLCEMLDIPFDIEATQNPKLLGKLLKSFSAHPLARVLNSALLRSLKQATYDTTNIGHFGLASSAYLHFTSPIRRYPDLLVHRAVHRLLLNQPTQASAEQKQQLTEAAFASSQAERKSMDVERQTLDLYRAHYMQKHLGEEFEGLVTTFVGSGAFVSIDDPFVEVMVKLEDLGEDSYEIDDLGFACTAARSGDRIMLGDTMRIEIVEVNLFRRTVYARRVQAGEKRERPPRAERRGHGKKVVREVTRSARPTKTADANKKGPARAPAKTKAKTKFGPKVGTMVPKGKKRGGGKPGGRGKR
jgi:ribonuclease R